MESLNWIFIIFTNGFPTEFSLIIITIVCSLARPREENFAEFHGRKKTAEYIEMRKKKFRSINQKPIKLLAYLCKNKKLSCQSKGEKKRCCENIINRIFYYLIPSRSSSVCTEHKSAMINKSLGLLHKMLRTRSYAQLACKTRLVSRWCCEASRNRRFILHKKERNKAINLSTDQLITRLVDEEHMMMTRRIETSADNVRGSDGNQVEMSSHFCRWLDIRTERSLRKCVTIRVKIFNRREGKTNKTSC